MTAERTDFVRAAGVRLRVHRHGDGPPLLLINGLGAALEMWTPLRRELRGFQVISFDMPGCGQSSAPRRVLGMGGLATVVEALLRGLGLPRAHVLGYSFGGFVAQELAHRHATRVDRLILCATTSGYTSRPPQLLAAWLMLTPARYYVPRAARVILPRIAGGRTRRDREAMDENVAHRLAHPPSLDGYARQLYAAGGFSSRRWLGHLQQPTLVLCGDDDPLVPVHNAHVLARTIPQARLELVPGAGHLLLLDEPVLAGGLIREFLDA